MCFEAHIEFFNVVYQGANTDVIYATFYKRNEGLLSDYPGTFDFADIFLRDSFSVLIAS